jgi:DNA-binding response OmpR family regulator
MLRLEGAACERRSCRHRPQTRQERLPDAIILDLRMPLVDGLGFLRQFRAIDVDKSVPVAIVTGDYFLDDAVARELQNWAPSRFKPLWLEDLVGSPATFSG